MARHWLAVAVFWVSHWLPHQFFALEFFGSLFLLDYLLFAHHIVFLPIYLHCQMWTQRPRYFDHLKDDDDREDHTSTTSTIPLFTQHVEMAMATIEAAAAAVCFYFIFCYNNAFYSST